MTEYSLPVVQTVAQLRKQIALFKQNKYSEDITPTVGFVPTMGALHSGHCALIKRSAKKCAITVVSIFVNPLQFGPGEDLDKYPRQLARDVQLAAESGAQLVFAPTVSSFYNAEHQTMIMNEQVASLYCGAYRPGHFAGVLTVVAKLFLAVEPTVAFFGKKDFQQAFLIQKMVSDLNWNISIELVPTVREKSGLARSSRNEFLSAEHRESAKVIYQVLCWAREQAKTPKGITVAQIRATFKTRIQKAGGTLQYAEVAHEKTLLPMRGKVAGNGVVLVAAYFGGVRLIDVLQVTGPLSCG